MVPCSSMTARPDGVWRRCGRELAVVAEAEAGAGAGRNGGWRVIVGIVMAGLIRMVLVLIRSFRARLIVSECRLTTNDAVLTKGESIKLWKF